MKKQSGALMTKVIMIVLFVAVLVYLGVYALRATGDKLTTTPAIDFTAEDSITVVGYLMRDEQTVSSPAEYIDVRVGDGEKVGRDQVIARTYSNLESLQRQKRIDELELSISQLSSVSISGSDLSAAAALDSEINSAVLSLSADTAAGDLSGAGDTVLSLKSLVLSRSEIFSGSGDIGALKSSLQAELDTLSAQTDSGSAVYSESSGLFSSLADGYEGALTPAALTSFSPADFDTLESYTPSVAADVFGKYIFGIRWYFISLVSEEDSALFTVGGSIAMRFVGGYTDELSMKVESITEPDDQGRCALILSCDRSMSETVALRRQTVDLISEQYTGIRVPRRALRVSEDGQTGVYCLVGVQAKFKAVTVVHEFDDYFVVERNVESPYALHAGDEIITNTKDLYDGKVLQS